MAAVILTVLKVIGIILLCIISLVLLLLVIVLFAPIHYSAEGSCDGRLSANVRADWLCFIIRFRLDYGTDGLSYSLKLLWLKLLPKEKKKEPVHKERRTRKAADNDDTALPETISDQEIHASFSGTADNGHSENTQSAKEPKPSVISRLREKYDSFKKRLTKIRFKINGICDRIRNGDLKLRHYKDIIEDEATGRAVSELLLRIRHLCRHILPRRFRARLHFGLDDPADTGELLGTLYMFYPVYTDHVTLQPDFDGACFDGDAHMKGHVQIFFIIYAALKIYFNKDILRLYNKIRG